MFRIGAAALVMNDKKEFLLVNLEAFELHHYSVPGGGQDKSETLLECAYRELREELNIDQDDLLYIGASNNPLYFYFKAPQTKEGVEYIGSEKHYFGFRFVGDVSKITPAQGEVRSYKWVSYDDLKDHLLFSQQLNDTVVRIREIFT